MPASISNPAPLETERHVLIVKRRRVQCQFCGERMTEKSPQFFEACPKRAEKEHTQAGAATIGTLQTLAHKMSSDIKKEKRKSKRNTVKA
jgi:hypothetical protein